MAAVGVLIERDLGTGPLVVIAAGGVALCVAWWHLVRSYKQLNTAKFNVIHAIEGRLPLAPYDAEWVAVGRGEDPTKYQPFSHIELTVPWIFGALYLALVLWGLWR